MWISRTLFNVYFSKVPQRALLWLTSCPDVGFLNAGTLQLTQPLLPLCFDEKQMLCSFSLSVLVCVCSFSLKHTEISCCISQVLLVMILFPLLLRSYFMVQTLNLSHCPWWLKCGYGQENRLHERRMTSWPHVFSINNFHIQFASQAVQQPLRDTALLNTTQPLWSISLRCGDDRTCWNSCWN